MFKSMDCFKGGYQTPNCEGAEAVVFLCRFSVKNVRVNGTVLRPFHHKSFASSGFQTPDPYAGCGTP